MNKKNSKNRAIHFLVFLISMAYFSLIPCSQNVLTAADYREITVHDERGIKKIDKWQIMVNYWHDLEMEIRDYLPSWEMQNIWRQEDKLVFPSLGELIAGLAKYLFKEVAANIKLMGQLIILAVVASLLKSLQGAFGSQEVARLTEVVVFFVLLGIAISSFSLALEIGKETVNSMVNILFALLPVLFTLMASLGHVTSAAFFHPLIVGSVNVIASLVQNIFLPLIFIATILYLLDHFSPDFKINRLASFLKDISIWGIGLMLTIFVGITGIQGVAAGVGDAVSLRSAKFLSGTFIPVVGKAMADAVETVLGYSLLLKNNATVVGLAVLTVSIIFPLAKILALVLIYKFSGALVQPLGESSLAAALDTMGSCLALVFAAVATVGLAFFIGVTIVIGISNGIVMLR